VLAEAGAARHKAAMAELLIGLNGVALNFGGDPVLEDVSLTIGAGDRLCLVGRNGSGKSTLMKLLAGEIEPDQGERVQAERSLVTRLEQDPDFTGFSTLGDYVAGGAAAGDDWRLAQVLGPLAPDAGLDPAKASGGERRRAALARALARGGDLLLLDEPTNHLDLETREALTVALAQFEGTLVLVSHDRHLLRATTDEFMIVADGGLKSFDGDLDDYRDWLFKTRLAQPDGGIQKTEPRIDRKTERRVEAELRQRLSSTRKPIEQRIAQLEKQLDKLNGRKSAVDARLADANIYADAIMDELKRLLMEQAELAAALDEVESEWLTQQEALESL
jgi:ATP-binding cassette subfamily F protein 3